MNRGEGESHCSTERGRGGRFGAVLVFGALFAGRLVAGNFYPGTSPANVPWPGGVVPYEFTNTLTAAEQQTYLDGLREWELAASVKFVPHTNQTRWILFTYDTNGFDKVSTGTAPQVVSVASLSRAQVCHEMGHSFGFTHENIRPDAASFITVLTNNIADEPSNIVWFEIDPASVTNGPYDFESVMHLGWDFDSSAPGVLATQQPKPPYFPRSPHRLGNFCLSPGDRAALAYLYGPPAVPLTNVVSTTADYGPGSLRAAIYYATDHPGTTVRFDIPSSDPGYSNGVFTIHLTGMLPPLVAAGTVIDGATQPGFAGRPLVFVDASQILPETFTSDTFLIYSGGNQIKNISFSGFNWNGLTLEYADATNNTVSGCWFGLDATGTNAAPNAFQGILIFNGAGGNIIGGTNAPARNVFSGNSQYGVYLTGTTGNVLLGNYIGTDFSGRKAVANGFSGLILDEDVQGTVIGGTSAPTRNVISGNTNAGVWFTGSGVSGNTVQGNWIGLNAAGTAALPNTFIGMYLLGGAQSNRVVDNVFSGHPSEGLRLSDIGTSFNVVQGNYFGTDAGGSQAIPNGFAGVTLFGGASSNTVGGTFPAARNVLSGNYYGAVIGDPGTSGNVVEGNLIGVGPDGHTALPNTFAGLSLRNGATSNLVGGTASGAGNVISANTTYGLFLTDAGTGGNRVEGNLIGTDLTGTNAQGNGFADVELQAGAAGNFIGGINTGAGNVIAFSGGTGVLLFDPATTNNAIRGNSIFDNANIGIDLNNDGVTPNHLGVLAGPNDFQNYPVITNAFGYGRSTVVSGTLNSLADASYSIDLYGNVSADASGYGEGQIYLGSVGVTTDNSGKAAFAFTSTAGNYAGQYITATATAAGGDTSEFSLAVLAADLAAPQARFVGPFVADARGFAFALSLETNFTYRIQATTNLAANPVVWVELTNFIATASRFNFVDLSATNHPARFYRVASP